MSDDIVNRLRSYWLDPAINKYEVDICVDAANLLEEQQAEIERLRNAVNIASDFIEHRTNCGSRMGKMRNCDCGFDAAWSILENLL